MILKKYIVNNMQEGMEKIKREFGSEALILNTKEVKHKGFKGWWKKPKLEVLVAYDKKDNISIENFEPERTKKDKAKKSIKMPFAQPIISKNQEISNLENKISSMDQALNTFLKRFDNNYIDRLSDYSENIKILIEKLLNNDVREEIVYKIADDINKLVKEEKIDEPEAINNVIRKFLGKGKPIALKRNKPAVVLFLGATGVGKTTTLSKLATIFVFNKNKKIALVTTDTYKIASYEQLKVYSDILSVPFNVVYSNDEIKGLMNKHQDKDIIFIDTGKCPDEQLYHQNISELIDLINPDEIQIVLNAHTNYKSCVKIIESYSYIKNYKFIITKIDEDMSLGTIFNIRALTSKPISYLTSGQVLTEDIEEYSADKILEQLMG